MAKVKGEREALRIGGCGEWEENTIPTYLGGDERCGLTLWIDNSLGLMSIPKFDEEVDDGRL